MSDNLSLSQVAAAQNQKEVTINDQAGQIDAALTEVLSLEVDNTNAATLTDEQFRRHFFVDIDPDTTPPDATVTITVPAIRRGLFALRNNTAQTVSVTVSGQSLTTPEILAGEAALLSCDGANVRAEGSGDGSIDQLGDVSDVVVTTPAQGQVLRRNGSSQWVNEDTPYDLGMFIPGTHGNGALMAQLVLTRAVSFPEDLTGSSGYFQVNATGSTVLDLRKNGVSIGTITFTGAGSTASFSLSGGASFAVGDRLAIINQNPADATLADLSITLKGTRD